MGPDVCIVPRGEAGVLSRSEVRCGVGTSNSKSLGFFQRSAGVGDVDCATRSCI